MKVCKCCKSELDIICFGLDKKKKDGYNIYCKMCLKKKRASDKEKTNKYNRIYYINNKEKIISDNKKYYNENTNAISLKKRKYYFDNNEFFKEKRKNYYYLNREIELKNKKNHNTINKEKIYKYKIDRTKIDKVYHLKEIIRKNILASFCKNGYSKKSRTYEILGCSFEEFKTYLENKFEPWMNWSNHGKYNGEFNFGWDIDHIIPISSAKSEEEIIQLNHYTNLQPLCSYINRVVKRNL